MPKNVLELWPQVFSIAIGTLVLLGAALAFSFRHRARIQPGSSGHRAEQDQGDSEIIGPDGYIDSFGGVIEEAGGGLPFMGKLIIAVMIASWFAYLILYWTPR